MIYELIDELVEVANAIDGLGTTGEEKRQLERALIWGVMLKALDFTPEHGEAMLNAVKMMTITDTLHESKEGGIKTPRKG